jgi:hypothetical protein
VGQLETVDPLSCPKKAIKRLSADPQDAVTESGLGLALAPTAPLEISGGVVPCQLAALIRIAIAVKRSFLVVVTVTLVSPPDAIR